MSLSTTTTDVQVALDADATPTTQPQQPLSEEPLFEEPLPLPPPIPVSYQQEVRRPSTPTSAAVSSASSPSAFSISSIGGVTTPNRRARPTDSTPTASASDLPLPNSCAFSPRLSPTPARARAASPANSFASLSPSSRSSSRAGSSRAGSPLLWRDIVEHSARSPKKSKPCRRSVISMKTLLPLSLPSAAASSSSTANSSATTTPTSTTTMASSSTSASSAPSILGPAQMSSSSSSRINFQNRKRYDSHQEPQRQRAGSPLASFATEDSNNRMMDDDDDGNDDENEHDKATHMDPVIPDFDFCNLPEMLARDLELSSALFQSRNLSSGMPMSRLAAERFEGTGRSIPSLVLRGSVASAQRDSATFGARSDRIGSPSISSPRSIATSNPLTSRDSSALDDTASETSRSDGDMEALYVHQSTVTAATSTASEHYKSESITTPLSPARSMWAEESDSIMSEHEAPHKVLISRRPESRQSRQGNKSETRAPNRTPNLPQLPFSNPFDGGKATSASPQSQRPASKGKAPDVWRPSQQDIGARVPGRRSSLGQRGSTSSDAASVQQRMVHVSLVSADGEEEDTISPTALRAPSRTTSVRTTTISRASSTKARSRTPSIHTQPAIESPTSIRRQAPAALMLKPIPKPDDRRRERRELLEPKSQRAREQREQREQRDWDTLSSDSLPMPPRISTSSRIISPSKSASTLPPTTPRVTVGIQTWLETSMAPRHKRNLSDEYPGFRPGAMPLPPDVLDTLRISVSCFPETMLLTNSLSVDTIRSYSRKFKRPGAPQSSSTFDSFKSSSNSNPQSTPSPQQHPLPSKKWTWARMLSGGKRSSNQLTGIGPDTRLDPERQRTDERPPWMALKNVFTSGASDYLCDALYAHVIAYNYVNAVCSRLTPPPQPANQLAGSKSRPGSRNRSSPSSSCQASTIMSDDYDECDEEDEDEDEGESDNSDTLDEMEADQNPSNEIPRKAACLLGLSEPNGGDTLTPRNRGVERKSSIAVLREALAANSNTRNREGDRERMTETAVKTLHAGLGKCIARLVATMRCPEEDRFPDRLLVEEPTEVDVLFLRSVCEIVRCVEETQGSF